MKKSRLSKADLRRLAEEKLSKQKQATHPEADADIQRLIRELKLRQIEVEIQNEDMAHTLAELEAALRQYTDLYDFAPVGYFTLGNDGTILQANLAGANLLGVEHEELTRRRLGAFVSNESLPAYNAFFEKLLLSEGKATCELAFEKKRDGMIWTRLEASCFEGGEVCRATLTDLTARKRMASLLQSRMRISEFVASHTFNELLQKTLDEAEILTDSQVGFIHFLDADQKTLRLQMWSTNTLENCTSAGKGEHVLVDQARIWADCVSTRAPLVHNNFANLARQIELPQGHVPIVRELVAPVVRNGLVVMLMGVGNKTLYYNDYDVEIISQLASSVWDIAQRKQAEDALHVSEERYRTLAESAPDMIYVIDREDQVQYVNTFAAQQFGAAPEQIMGKPRSSLFPPDVAERQARSLKYVFDSGQSSFTEDTVRFGEREVWINNWLVPLRDESGAVTAVMGISRDITARKRAEQALEAANLELQTALVREQQLARTDPLTGVNNRRYLYEFAEHVFGVAARYQKPLSVIMFDIDRFKKINDNFGHMVGDRMLELVTQVARAELRSADVIGRYGGEEFIILLPMTNAQQAYPLAERIRASVAELRVPTPKGDASVTLSIGITEMLHESPPESVEDVFRRADEAMYAAKQAGRNRTEIGGQ